MKFTIGQRVRFYVSKEFLEGQDSSAECSPGWIIGKITRIHPEYTGSLLPVQVTLDSETDVFKCLNTLNFTREGNFYINMHNKNAAEQLTLQPLTIILKRRHL